MNSLSESVKNYLVVANSPDYKPQLYRLCLQKAKADCLIVLITSEVYDFSTIIDELGLNKEQLQNFIIMYFMAIDDISHKLLLLHSWSLLPHTVIVDLCQLLTMQTDTCSTSANLMQKVTLCASSLLAFLDSVAFKSIAGANANANNTVNGFLILRKEAESFGETQIQIIKDLYFYKTKMLQDFEAIEDLFLNTEGNFQ